ncbi:Cof-type HAD-IIB family hydrolase [Mycoplasma sp. CSL7475-4]|uniref:YcsE-related riboflavin metabolism phosphatase n=1 Tax=Mycoplasma sp. CSL7475-4 TaxID=2973942 RepID=UPI00216B55DF|nr:HAD family hydrolase [Mycoplasma sp. CSL7475-4]MCS4536937.1 Cof-type HAD-IIB family hydrolase [Mycoplasma sp. CSL7475-4]
MTKTKLKANIKLAAFDIDGTLLPYEQLEFSDNVTKMFKALKNSGIYSVLATAREFITIGELMNKTPDLDYFIGANGMFVYDLKKETIIYERTISLHDLRIIYEALKTIPQSRGLTITDLDWCYHTPGMNLDTWFLRPHHAKMRPMDFEAIDKEHLHIITIQTNNQEETDIVVKEIKAIIEENNLDVEINSTWHRGLFICPKGVTKSHTIDWLANHLKLSNTHNVIAFGDSSNDVEMVSNAAWGVVMEEADESLKKLANDIAKSVKVDGAYLKLKELELIN